jgi:phage tail sheath protein FI
MGDLKRTRARMPAATPGVFVADAPAPPLPIEPIETATAAFVGIAARGSYKPRLVRSLVEFERAFGPVQAIAQSYLGRAVQGFFANGGRNAWIARVAASRGKFTAAAFLGTATRIPRGLAAIAAIDEMLQLVAPDLSHPRMTAADRAIVRDAMIGQATTRRDRIILLDSPQGDRRLGMDDSELAAIDAGCVAIYGPWVSVATADGTPALMPPSGHLAGIVARVDAERGVHKAPANEVIRDILGFEFDLTDSDQGVLNPNGFNALRHFPDRGLRVWGARLLSRDPEWRYINVRRLAMSIELSLTRGLVWTVFEPNGEPLWARVRQAVSDHLTTRWCEGALLGQRADQAFFVRCDRSTMTQADIDRGRLICEIGIAPLMPAEFFVIRIGVWSHRDP